MAVLQLLSSHMAIAALVQALVPEDNTALGVAKRVNKRQHSDEVRLGWVVLFRALLIPHQALMVCSISTVQQAPKLAGSGGGAGTSMEARVNKRQRTDEVTTLLHRTCELSSMLTHAFWCCMWITGGAGALQLPGGTL